MGADLLIYTAAIPVGRTPDWEAAERRIAETAIDDLLTFTGAVDEEDEARDQLREDLAEFRSWWSGESDPRDLAWLELRGLDILLTGGLSSGDAPTDAAEVMGRLDEAGVLTVAGFNGPEREETPSHEIATERLIA